jgi:8-oxo-dGTP diphosphatase
MTAQRMGVGAIIHNEEGKILLSQRGEKARDQVGLWENIGGGVEPGEDPRDTIVREVIEEIGAIFTIKRELLRYNQDHQTEGYTWMGVLFEGSIDREPRMMEPGWCLALGWFELGELAELPLASFAQEDFRHLGWLMG